MGFEWDEAKKRLNLKKHGIDFEDAREVFDSPILSALDTREDYGEDRWIAIGVIRSIVVVIAFTERGSESVRIISARKATKNEKEKYHKQIKNQLR